jgi:hypothetical protein
MRVVNTGLPLGHDMLEPAATMAFSKKNQLRCTHRWCECSSMPETPLMPVETPPTKLVPVTFRLNSHGASGTPCSIVAPGSWCQSHNGANNVYLMPWARTPKKKKKGNEKKKRR